MGSHNPDEIDLATYFTFLVAPLYEMFFQSDNHKREQWKEQTKRFAMTATRYFDENPEMLDQLRERINIVDHQNEALYTELRTLALDIGEPEIVDKIDSIWQKNNMDWELYSDLGKDPGAFSSTATLDKIESLWQNNTMDQSRYSGLGQHPGLLTPAAMSYLQSTAKFRNDLSALLNDSESKPFADAVFSRDSSTGFIVASYLGPEGHQAFQGARDVWKEVSDAIFQNFGEVGPAGIRKLDPIGEREREFSSSESSINASTFRL